MVQENIKVVARIRPFSNSTGGNDQSCVECNPGKSTITVENSKYCFDKTFDADVTQEHFFNNICTEIINGFVGGFHGTIFAYGQTGSGKTYTMVGNDIKNLESETKGIIPRAIRRIFEILEAETQDKPETFKYILKCSFFQIYNKNIYDLLQKQMKALKIQTCTNPVTVKDAVEIKVNNFEECMNQIQIGLNQRKTAETSMNQESSRSHAILQLSLETQTCVNGFTNNRLARLNLVDLAGSERQSQTGNTGKQLLEAGSINNSLSVLGRVIRAILDKNKYIPYADTTLTNLLRDSLGGNSKTVMAVNVHPNFQFVNQTISTLEFAKNVKLVKNTAKINESFSCEELESCKAEIGLLRQENDDLKSQVSTLCGEKSSLESAVSKHEEKIEDLETQLSEAKNKIYQFENDESSFVVTERYEKQLESKTNEIKNLEIQLGTTKNQVEDLKNTAENELASKTNENEILMKENYQLKNDAIIHTNKIQELQNKNAELEEEIYRLKCGTPYSNEQESQDHDFDSGIDEGPTEGTFKWYSTHDAELKEKVWEGTFQKKPETYDVITRESWNLRNEDKLSSGIEINFNGIRTFLKFDGCYNDGYLFVCGNCQQLYNKEGNRNIGKAYVFEGEDGKLDVSVLAHNGLCVSKRYLKNILKRRLLPLTVNPLDEFVFTEYFGYENSGSSKYLIVFDWNDPTKCYRYILFRKYYRCYGCINVGHPHSSIKILPSQNGKIFAKVQQKHGCQPSQIMQDENGEKYIQFLKKSPSYFR